MDASLHFPAYRPVSPRSWGRERWIVPVLLLLTLIGGLLRFNALDRPMIWGDEAATAGRIVGSHQDLLDQLAEGTFTPLHYEIGWWIAQGMPYWGKITQSEVARQDGSKVTRRVFEPTHRLIEGGVKMTPFMLRLVPALCGTLMIPAVYFLARQMFGPRVSLLAAGFCCFSAYLLIYSRDAKMYMPFWLMVTLNIACLLWWLRVRAWTAWLCWIATGSAMMGLHALGGFILLVNGLIVLSSSGQCWSGWIKLFGLILWPIMLAVAGLYALARRRWELKAWWRFKQVLNWPARIWPEFRFPTVLLFAFGVGVIVSGTLLYFNHSEHFQEVVQEDGEFSTDANGTGWVERYNAGRDFGSLVRYTAGAYLIGWEWPRNQWRERVNDEDRVDARTLKLLKTSLIVILALLAIGAFPWRRVFSPARARLERITQDGRVDPRFARRRVLWVGLMLVAPAYLIYTQSVASPVTVLDGVSTIALKAPTDIQWPRLTRAGKDQNKLSFYADQSRYRSFGQAFAKSWSAFKQQFSTDDNLAATRLAILGLIALILIAVLILRRRIMARTAFRLLIAGAIIVLLCAIIGVLPRFPDQSIWMPRYVGLIFPALAIVVAALISRQPARWMRIATFMLIVVVNLAQYATRVYGHTEPPSGRIAQDILRGQPRPATTTQPATPTFRAYLAFRFRGPGPGGGTFPSPPANYYLWLDTQLPDGAKQIRHNSYHARLKIWNAFDAASIQRDLNRSRQIDRFVLWTSLDWNRLDLTDKLGDQLKGQFRRVSDEIIPIYDHWRWLKLANLRRREYIRIAQPATAPITVPSTRPAAAPAR